ncbi:glycosyl hydrolase [Trichophyton equinum CBS 127.97]|uniref:beta-glucosidase n=1 Tax=Trichophyton equinum (strain ATCC MYA-4606 / CBS 127.97) TaxID=559882 RepID=F2Q101_TRIEC|nr:glycosyl hydrolase [Trichophyton equinum CBS 127.97]
MLFISETWRLVLPLLLFPCLFTAASGSSPATQTARADVPPGYNSPPYYPTPKGGWVQEWQAAYAKAAVVVANMTLAEKVNLTTGTGIFMGPCVGQTGSALRFGIPNLCLQDGPLGVRNTDHNTAFPAGITVGATFDKKLMYERGVAMGFGADPSLQAIGGALTIKGVQKAGVIATVKHLVGNEQEIHRMTNVVQRGYSSNIDDRTLHELYLWPFAEAVRAGVGALMMAYKDVNGSTCSQNSLLINGILKDELGFQGLVMSDWFGQIGGVSSALAGLDMAMPGDGSVPLTGSTFWAHELSRSILNGTIPLERLNDMVTRVVATWFQFGQDDNYPEPNFSTNTQEESGLLYPGAVFSPRGIVNKFVDVQGNHKEIARTIARDAITLVKNKDNLLPLKTSASIAIFGEDAGTNPNGINFCADKGCNKGVLTMGWGSGTSRLPYLSTPEEAIKNRSETARSYITNKFPSNIKVKPEDVAIVFVNSDSGENYITVERNPGDRSYAGLELWYGGDELIQEAAKKFSSVVVVVHTVGPTLLEKWVDLPAVKSVLIAHLPGQEAGNAVTDILFGDVSPSGHLPYTIPKSESDYSPSSSLLNQPFGQIQDNFVDGLYVDYRHFQKEGKSVRYPFGYGLSYTTFGFDGATITAGTRLSEYPPPRMPKGMTPIYTDKIPDGSEVAWPRNFHRIWRYLYPYLNNPASVKADSKFIYPEGYQTTPQPDPRAGGSQGGNPALWDIVFTVAIKIKNTGRVPGRAVAQVYVELPTELAANTPKLQLRQFEKTSNLAPGQEEVLKMELTRKDLSIWDVVTQDWRAPVDGKGVKFYIGESVEDLHIVCETSSGTCRAVS